MFDNYILDTAEGDFIGNRRNFSGVNWHGMSLSDKQVDNCVFTHACFRKIRASGVNFSLSLLIKTDMADAYTPFAVFNKADLSGAIMEGIFSPDASFISADMTRALFHGAFLQRSNMKYATLTQASFVGASLGGVNFDNTNLTGVDFDSAIISKTTSFKNADMTNVRNIAWDNLQVKQVLGAYSHLYQSNER